MNVVEHVPLWHGEHHLGIFSRVVLLGHQVDLFPFFKINTRMISRMVVTGCNSTSNGRVFLFLHILNNTGCHLTFLNVVNLIGVKWDPGVILLLFCWFLFSLNIYFSIEYLHLHCQW